MAAAAAVLIRNADYSNSCFLFIFMSYAELYWIIISIIDMKIYGSAANLAIFNEVLITFLINVGAIDHYIYCLTTIRACDKMFFFWIHSTFFPFVLCNNIPDSIVRLHKYPKINNQIKYSWIQLVCTIIDFLPFSSDCLMHQNDASIWCIWLYLLSYSIRGFLTDWKM